MSPRPGRKQLVTDTDTPLEDVSEWEVVPPGGSAHILQNDRLSVQYVACYIHNTEAVERSQDPTTTQITSMEARR